MRKNPRTVSRTRNEVTSLDSTRVAMWSGPRNISTALMYSFENRSDCYATDEPLYASFLLKSGTPHPGAEEVIENNEAEVGKIIKTLTGPIPDEKQLWYQKHMCHHLPPDSDISWIDNFKNCFLIRNPREVLLSLSKITASIDLLSTGLPQQLTIFRHVIKSSGKSLLSLIPQTSWKIPNQSSQCCANLLAYPSPRECYLGSQDQGIVTDYGVNTGMIPFGNPLDFLPQLQRMGS